MIQEKSGTMDFDSANRLIERVDAAAQRRLTGIGPGANMVWRRWGSGPPVVLLHGGAGSWLHWIRNIEYLAGHRTVWVPDMPGFGDSDLSDERHDADTIAPLVLDGIREVLGDARFDLVGFSFGGLVAGYIAERQPPGLNRLILVSVAALGIVAEPPALKSMRGIQDPAQRIEIVRWNLNQMMLYAPQAVDDLAVVVQQRSAPRDRLRHRSLALTDALFGLAPHWRVPVFGIWGTQDVLYRQQMPLLHAAIERIGLSGADFMEDAGHWLQYELADDFNRRLSAVLDAQAPGGAVRRCPG